MVILQDPIESAVPGMVSSYLVNDDDDNYNDNDTDNDNGKA